MASLYHKTTSELQRNVRWYGPPEMYDKRNTECPNKLYRLVFYTNFQEFWPKNFFVPEWLILNFSGPCALIQFIEDGSDNEDDDQEDPEDICEKNCDDAMQPVCVNFQFFPNFQFSLNFLFFLSKFCPNFQFSLNFQFCRNFWFISQFSIFPQFSLNFQSCLNF